MLDKIAITRNGPTYLVRVGDHVYEMSSDADMPNGVCQYVGVWDRTHEQGDGLRGLPAIVPAGILRQIDHLQECDGNCP